MSYQHVRQKIIQAEHDFGREPGSVQLIAVSKRQSLDAIVALSHQGQTDFAENVVQEALTKIPACHDLGLTWHFIGQLQANKTHQVAEHFAWVHSVDREKIARRLATQRPIEQPDLNICIQVNLDNETQKSGIALDELEAFAEYCQSLPKLKLRGLMAVPKPRTDFDAQRASFKRLKYAFNALQQRGYSLDTLSMGMSGDYRAAIAEGATMVRIGTLLFGERS